MVIRLCSFHFFRHHLTTFTFMGLVWWYDLRLWPKEMSAQCFSLAERLFTLPTTWWLFSTLDEQMLRHFTCLGKWLVAWGTTCRSGWALSTVWRCDCRKDAFVSFRWGLASLQCVFWCDIWHERLFPWKSCIWCISVSNGKRENGIKSNWYNTWWSEILILRVLMNLVVDVDFISWSS